MTPIRRSHTAVRRYITLHTLSNTHPQYTPTQIHALSNPHRHSPIPPTSTPSYHPLLITTPIITSPPYHHPPLPALTDSRNGVMLMMSDFREGVFLSMRRYLIV